MWIEQLHRDPALLDYFNKFLSSKAFTIQLSYDLVRRDFTINCEDPSLEVDESCRHKFIKWIEKERFRPFLKSRMYHLYELRTKLINECERAIYSSQSSSDQSSHRRRSTHTLAVVARRHPMDVEKLPSIQSQGSSSANTTSVNRSLSGCSRSVLESPVCHRTTLESPVCHRTTLESPVCHRATLESVLRNMDIHKILGSSVGMEAFSNFLNKTKGRDMIEMWLDIRELEVMEEDCRMSDAASFDYADGDDPPTTQQFVQIQPQNHLRKHLELKYSHMLAGDGIKKAQTLTDVKCLVFHRLMTYWLPRYLLQISTHTSADNSLYLPELFSRHTAHDTSFDEEEYMRDMDQFTAGLWSEASAGRPLMQYFMRNGMYGLAKMLLFWQSVEELKLLENKGVDDAVRDRLSWTIFKEFIADGSNLCLPVTDQERTQIVFRLHQSHMTTRVTAFGNIPTLCLSSLKRAWSSYLRSNFDVFLREITKTPLPPTPQPTPPPPQASQEENGKKKKSKKKKTKKKKKKMHCLSHSYLDEALSSVHSLEQVKKLTRMGYRSRASGASRMSRTSTKTLSQMLANSDPLATNLDACEGPMSSKLAAFQSYLKELAPQLECGPNERNFNFCMEVIKLKLMVKAKPDILVLQSKVEAIVDSYLDLAHPPWLLVAIPAHIVYKIVEIVAQHMEGVIAAPSMAIITRELELLEWAKQVLVNTLTPCWGEFLVKWHERHRKQSKKKQDVELGKEMGSGRGVESARTRTSLTCSLPSVSVMPALPNADKIKITYSLTTGAFWAKGSSNGSRMNTKQKIDREETALN